MHDALRYIGVALLIALAGCGSLATPPNAEWGRVLERMPTLAFEHGDVSVGENTPFVEVAVLRTGVVLGAARVDYFSRDGSAQAGADYHKAQGTLQWPAGDSNPKYLRIALIDDANVEPDEDFTISLTAASGAMIGPRGSLKVTIRDDDRDSSFNDIAGHWAAEYIVALQRAGIIEGCGGGAFCPARTVKRDEAATFIARALRTAPPNDHCASAQPFTDVPAGHWACGDIKRLKELKITSGLPDGTYLPSAEITRAQLAAFIIRAVEGEPAANACASGSGYRDIANDHGACKYIKRLADLNISQGCGKGAYCPDAPVTRAEMATFLGRAFLGMNATASAACGSNMSNYLGAARTDADTWPGTYCSLGQVGGLDVSGRPTAQGDTFTWDCAAPGAANERVQCSVARGHFVATSVEAIGTQHGGGIEPGKVVRHGTAGRFAISINDGYQATVTPTPATCGPPATYTANATYQTGTMEAACALAVRFAAKQQRDPGVGTGLWLPPGTANWWIVDQTGVGGAGIVNYVPGCVDRQPAPVNSSAACALDTSRTGYYNGAPHALRFGEGRVITTRFTAKHQAPTYDGDFQVDGPTGDNIGDSMSVWLTASPTQDFANTPPACKTTSNSHASIYTTLRGTPDRCPLTTGQPVYLHMRIDGACTTCRYKFYESSDVE